MLNVVLKILTNICDRAARLQAKKNQREEDKKADKRRQKVEDKRRVCDRDSRW